MYDAYIILKRINETDGESAKNKHKTDWHLEPFGSTLPARSTKTSASTATSF